VKPPYGRITAYNMNTGDIVFQVANGDTYDWIKTHPALEGIDIPKTGRADEGGIVVTRALMFAGQGCGLFRSGGRNLRARHESVLWQFACRLVPGK
jgi:quinoprotein glucose dehydrogenase